MPGLHCGKRNPYAEGTGRCTEGRMQRTGCVPWQLWPGNFGNAAGKALCRAENVCGSCGRIRRQPDWRARGCILRHAECKLQLKAAQRPCIYPGISGWNGRRMCGYDSRIHSGGTGCGRLKQPENYQLWPASEQFPCLQCANQAAV